MGASLWLPAFDSVFDGVADLLNALFGITNGLLGIANSLLVQALDLHFLVVYGFASGLLQFAGDVFRGAFDLVFVHGVAPKVAGIKVYFKEEVPVSS
jgi:hypothetical protein